MSTGTELVMLLRGRAPLAVAMTASARPNKVLTPRTTVARSKSGVSGRNIMYFIFWDRRINVITSKIKRYHMVDTTPDYLKNKIHDGRKSTRKKMAYVAYSYRQSVDGVTS